MTTTENGAPQPRRRLLKTLLKRPRNLRRFAPRIAYEEFATQLPEMEEVGHWGHVVLLSDAILALHQDGTVSQRFHLITMLHGEQDLSEWDEVTREYDRRTSRETILTAAVHLPDGKVRKAQQTLTPVEPYSCVINLTFSPLRPGIVLEFETQFDRFTPFEVASGIWSQMFLQGPAPKRRVRFTIAVAKPFESQIKLHHCDWKPNEFETGGYRVAQWDLRDVSGIEVDPWIPPLRDFVPWVDVTTLRSWEPVAGYYKAELDPPTNTPVVVKNLASDLTATAASDYEKVLSVYRYATRDVRYGRHPREIALEAPRESQKMLEDLRGDCKDKSALLVSMLRELGIPASVVLVQTRVNGKTTSLPAPWFDHAVVKTEIEGRSIWLDPAGGPYTLGSIPQNDQGVAALLLNGEEATLMEVPAAEIGDHGIERVCTGRIDEAGTYHFEAKLTARGDEAANLRLQHLNRSSEHQQRQLSQVVAADLTGAETSDVCFLELEDLSKDVVYQFSIRLPQWARQVQDILLCRIPWIEPTQTAGPMSAATRLQPLAAPGVLGLSDRHEIDLPAGYVPYGLPFIAEEECEWGRYRSSVVPNTKSQLICERKIELLGGIVPPERFSEFKRFWEACARADAADVVLMKSKKD